MCVCVCVREREREREIFGKVNRLTFKVWVLSICCRLLTGLKEFAKDSCRLLFATSNLRCGRYFFFFFFFFPQAIVGGSISHECKSDAD